MYSFRILYNLNYRTYSYVKVYFVFKNKLLFLNRSCRKKIITKYWK